MARRNKPTIPDSEPIVAATDLVALAEAVPDEILDTPTEPVPVVGDEPPGGEVVQGADEAAVDGEPDVALPPARMESIIESLLFASDKPLGVVELKRLLGERDGKKITAVMEALTHRHATAGVQVATVAGGWQLRTDPENAPWVGKLLSGRPVRLSRAMMETVAIVAYRQPITRPEIDEIRGVDCGPVLKTLLDRGLIRIIGKKEDVGRPMLYGTTSDFLKTFSLNDLNDLPTLRQFHELAAEEMARVDAQTGTSAEASASAQPSGVVGEGVHPSLIVDPEENDSLLEELDRAASAAARVGVGVAEPEPTSPG